MATKSHIAVIGAGAFGGWTALYLLRRGARVTLVDAWGPSNSRASSGGETRIIRCTYGPNQPYTKMAARAAQLWEEHEKRWKLKLLHRIAVLWMARAGDDEFERGSLPLLKDAGIVYEELSADEMGKRWPQINFEEVRWGIYEPDGGFLRARVACQAVLDGFLAEGGGYKQTAVLPNNPVGDKIRATKQEVFFFGTPAADDRFLEEKLPAWADHRDRFIYGIPGNDGRGFKIADDTRGPEFDPTTGERVVSAENLQRMREYLGFRFPALKDAPLIETRVCPYENTPDNHFIIDRHPAADNLWLVGGGSGHGFKHGPALGEMLATLILEGRDADPLFRLDRYRC